MGGGVAAACQRVMSHLMSGLGGEGDSIADRARLAYVTGVNCVWLWARDDARTRRDSRSNSIPVTR